MTSRALVRASAALLVVSVAGCAAAPAIHGTAPPRPRIERAVVSDEPALPATPKGHHLEALPVPAAVSPTAVDVSTDGATVVFGTPSNEVFTCDLPSARCRQVAPVEPDRVVSQALLSADGSSIVVVENQAIRVVDRTSGAERGLFHVTFPSNVARSPDRRLIAFRLADRVAVVDTITGREITSAKIGGADGRIAWSRDSRAFTVVASDQHARLVDAPTGAISAVVTALPSTLGSALSADRSLAVFSTWGRLVAWDLIDRKKAYDIDGLAGGAVAMRRDASLVAFSREGKKGIEVAYVDGRDGRPAGGVRLAEDVVSIDELRFFDDGTLVVRARNRERGDACWAFARKGERTARCVFRGVDVLALDDGPRAVGWRADEGLAVRDEAGAAIGSVILRPRTETRSVVGAAWGTKALFTVSPWRVLRTFDPATGALVRAAQLSAPDTGRSYTQRLWLSPDEATLAHGDGATLTVRDVDGTARFSIPASSADAAFSKDGAELYVTTAASLVRLDAHTGEPRAEAKIGSDARSIAVSPTGDVVVVDGYGNALTFDGRTLARKDDPVLPALSALHFMPSGIRVVIPLVVSGVDLAADGVLDEGPRSVLLGWGFATNATVASRADVLGIVELDGRRAHVFDLAGGRGFALHGELLSVHMAPSPDGRFFAVGGPDLSLVRVADGAEIVLSTLPGPRADGEGERTIVQTRDGAIDGDDDGVSRFHVVTDDGTVEETPPPITAFRRADLYARFVQHRPLVTLEPNP